jgi:hypothetical protein
MNMYKYIFYFIFFFLEKSHFLLLVWLKPAALANRSESEAPAKRECGMKAAEKGPPGHTLYFHHNRSRASGLENVITICFR